MSSKLLNGLSICILLFNAIQMAGPAICQAAEPAISAAPAAPAVAISTHRGVVLETMGSGSYTYSLVKEDNGMETWVAVDNGHNGLVTMYGSVQATISVGDYVEFVDTPPMTNFRNKTLKRTFEKIRFPPGLEITSRPAARAARPASSAAAPAAEGIKRLTSSSANSAQSSIRIPPAIIDPNPLLNLDAGDEVRLVRLSPDGRYLAAATSSGLFVYNVERQDKRKLVEGPRVNNIAFSPNGQHLAATRSDNTASVYCVNDWTEVATLKQGKDAMSVAFSSDGKYMGTGSGDKTARIFDTTTWKEIRSFDHPNALKSVAFNAAGDLFATACDDHTKIEIANLGNVAP